MPSRPLAAVLILVVIATAGLACNGGDGARPPVSQSRATATISAAPDEKPTSTATTAPPAPAATATAPPAAGTATQDADSIQLQQSSSLDYYPVYGTTSQEIVAYMTNYGPVSSDGMRGLGIAKPVLGLTWQPEQRAGACYIGSMSITIEVAVTVPRHAQLDALSPGLRTLWLEFADSIAKHEQRHVDIYFDGMKQLQRDMTNLSPARDGCTTLSTSVQSTWTTDIDRIKAAQDKFHADEDARLSAQRSALKSQYEATDVQLASLRGEIGSLETQTKGLESELTTLSAQATTLGLQLDAIKEKYPTLVLPPDVFSQFERLRVPYNVLISRYEDLTEQHDSLVDKRNALATQHDGLVDTRNRLVDRFNLTP